MLTQMLRSVGGSVPAALSAGIATALLVVGTARLAKGRAVRLVLLEAALAGYIMVLMVIVMWPSGSPAMAAQLVPFASIFETATNSVSAQAAVTSLGVPLALFAPAGALSALRYPKRRWVVAAGATLVVSLVQEVIQALLPSLGRVASVDDIILNVAGALVGCGAVEVFQLVPSQWGKVRPRTEGVTGS
jgi:glycopeptide antibiotics resistance protein